MTGHDRGLSAPARADTGVAALVDDHAMLDVEVALATALARPSTPRN